MHAGRKSHPLKRNALSRRTEFDFHELLRDDVGEERFYMIREPPIMRDIFISYSEQDTALAASLSGALKQAAARPLCAARRESSAQLWKSPPRSVTSTRLLILLLTPNANGSARVLREVRSAAASGAGIVAVCKKGCVPAKPLTELVSSAVQLGLPEVLSPAALALLSESIIGLLAGMHVVIEQSAPVEPVAVPPVVRTIAGGAAVRKILVPPVRSAPIGVKPIPPICSGFAPSASSGPLRCRPLRDPVRLLGLIVKWYWALISCYLAVHYAVYAYESGQYAVFIFLIAMLSMLVASMPTIAALLLLRVAPKRAVLVRRFKSDDTSLRIQKLLAAGLGDDYRICGIRSPQKRSSRSQRALLWSHVVINYLGSPHQQLEGENHDWLVRLIRTLEKTELAIVDARDASEHVMVEAKTCLTALGPKRCLILVDKEQSSSASAATFGLPKGPGSSAVWLAPPEGRDAEDAFVRAVSAATQALPPKPADGRAAALAVAQGSLGQTDKPTPFFDTDFGQFFDACVCFAFLGCLFFLAVMVCFGSAATDIASDWLSVLLNLGFAGCCVLAWRRLWQAAKLDLPSTVKYCAAIRKRLVWSAIAGGLTLTAWLVILVTIPVLGKQRQLALERTQMARMVEIAKAIQVYQFDHKLDFPAHPGTYELSDRFQNLLATVRSDLPANQVSTDVWGRPLFLERDVRNRMFLISCGLDGKTNTTDDLMVNLETSEVVLRKFLKE